MCESLEENSISRNIICNDIEKVSNEELEAHSGLSPNEVDIYRTEMTHGTDDSSFQTVVEYFRVVEFFKPKMFVFENVHTFAAKRQKGAIEYVVNTAKELGYNLSYEIVNAADYGVPQKRQRIFVVGHLHQKKFDFPNTTHIDPQKKPESRSELPVWKTAGQAISDLDVSENNSNMPGHFAGGKHHQLLHEIPSGDNYLYFTEKRGHKNPIFKWRSRYWSFLLKLSPDLPSWTIQARRSNNMGPLHWRNRILTIAEVKRLQTFPDDFYLSGTIEKQWRQIGNAVPPRLSEQIGQAVYRYLDEEVSLNNYQEMERQSCQQFALE